MRANLRVTRTDGTVEIYHCTVIHYGSYLHVKLPMLVSSGDWDTIEIVNGDNYENS